MSDSGSTKEETYWNGEPAKARIVRVVVGEVPNDSWWCAGMVGTIREAVEVKVKGQEPFFIDNENGDGWWKVTTHQGKSHVGHRTIPDAKIASRDDEDRIGG